MTPDFRPRYRGAIAAIILVAAVAVVIGMTFLSTYRELVSPPKVPIWRIRTDTAAASVDFSDGTATVKNYASGPAALLIGFRNKRSLRCTVQPKKRRTCPLPQADWLVHLALCSGPLLSGQKCLELRIGE